MSIIDAIVFGIIQGLTEFLPVSSSGHLELAKVILGDESVGKESMLMTVVLHFATALSTVVIFRKELLQIFKGLFQFKWNDELKFSLKIILSMVPAAFVGVVFKEEIESLFGGQVLLVGSMLVLTGVLLYLADKAKKSEKDVSYFNAILIGISQAIAILPGISRSGATISTSVILGVDREKAARFSFLMVVPLIFGAILFDAKDYMETREMESNVAEERTLIISEELVDDEILTADQSNKFQSVLLAKEINWDKQKNMDNSNISTIEDKFESDLTALGFAEETNKTILSHEWAQVRVTKGPNILALSLGFIFAFITGLIACTWMIALVKRAKLKYFSIYCFVVGFGAITYALINAA
jgi:undecaprenyl-diphosphatase